MLSLSGNLASFIMISGLGMPLCLGKGVDYIVKDSLLLDAPALRLLFDKLFLDQLINGQKFLLVVAEAFC